MVLNPSGLSYEERRELLQELEQQGDRIFARIEAKAAQRDSEIDRARREAKERRGAPVQRGVELAALHEAGHAVLAALAGAEVQGVAVFAASGGGVCWTQGGRNEAFLGGAEAEKLAGHIHAQPSTADLELVRGSGRDATLAAFQAQDLLGAHWKKVERLAEMLIHHGYVSGQLVHDVAGAGYA